MTYARILPNGIVDIETVAKTVELPLFSELRTFADQFAAALGEGLPCNYRWSRDPLSHWSRLYEYPYVLERFSELDLGPGQKIASLGAGFTFFEFLLATKHLECEFFLFDFDPKNVRNLEYASSVLGLKNVVVIKKDITTFGRGEHAFDVLFSISVLEHLPDPLLAPPSMANICHADSKLILTFDYSRDAKSQVHHPKMLHLFRELQKHFVIADADDFAAALTNGIGNEATLRAMVRQGLARGPWKNYWLSYIKCVMTGNRSLFLDPSMGFACLEMRYADH
jgi:hypothetical protein